MSRLLRFECGIPDAVFDEEFPDERFVQSLKEDAIIKLFRADRTSRQNSAAKPLQRVVSNSTPLIALAQCNLFSFLQILFGQVLIPPAVYREVVSEGDGESEALALARQQPTDVIVLDETRAVRCAREIGWPEKKGL